MLLRLLPLLIALVLCLAPSSQAAVFVAAPPASAPLAATPENAGTAFLERGSESRIGLLCHNDPVNKTDPLGLDPGPGRDFIVGFDYAATGGIATGIMNAFDPTFGADVDTGSTAYTSGSRAGLAPGGLRVGAQKLIGLGVKVYRKGAAFSRATKDQVKEANRQKNDGKLRSDQSGQEAQPGQQSKKGVTPAGNEANVDHVQPKSKGGDNSPDNAQILTRDENLKKGNR